MYPSYQARLGRRDLLRFKQAGHGQQEDVPAEKMALFPVPYLHYSFSKGMKDWLRKHIRYAEAEADLILFERADASSGTSRLLGASEFERRRRAKKRATKIPIILRPVGRFVYMFVLRMGFRDGMVGLVYSFMMCLYESMIALFVYEKLRSEAADAINACPFKVKDGEK
jgi:hypothetical protein